jgi:hypothetical protein
MSTTPSGGATRVGAPGGAELTTRSSSTAWVLVVSAVPEISRVYSPSAVEPPTSSVSSAVPGGVTTGGTIPTVTPEGTFNTTRVTSSA